MDSEEREIFYFLKTWGEEFVSGKEIARRAGGKKKFHQKPDWARPLLLRMTERGLLESDVGGRYRIKPVRKEKTKRWVSPEIAKILEESGVQVEGRAAEAGTDEYYEQL